MQKQIVVRDHHSILFTVSKSQLKSGETAANIARELAEQTRNHLNAGDITYSVRAMDQLVGLLDVQLRNLTPGGKDSAARSLNKVRTWVNVSLGLQHSQGNFLA